MAKFKKAILHAGRTYHSPDGDVKVTPERLKRWEANHKRLTAANYAAPTAWDHAADLAGASPVKLSRKGELPSAEKTVGKLAGFKVAKDGSHAEILLDITDPIAKGRVERNEVFVSPIIMDRWQDGAKNVYEDVITHVDLVTWPVDNSQKPFVPVEPGTIACGIRMGLTRMAFPDDVEDDGEESDTETESPADPPAKPENPDLPKSDEPDQISEAIRAHLEQLKISLPSTWTMTSDNAGEILLTGLKTAVLAQQTAEPKEDEEEEEDEDVMQVQDPAFAAMSLKANAAHNFAERQYRGSIQARLASLLSAGRCTPAEATTKETEVKAVRLSLAADGEPNKSDLEKWIESREEVPQGTFWSAEVRTQKLSLQVQDPPAADGSNPEQDAELVNWALGRKKK